MICIFIGSLITCSDEPASKNGTEDVTVGISSEVVKLLDEMIQLMKNKSINKAHIDWGDFRSRVYKKIPGAITVSDSYPGIEEALIMLGDHHSFYITRRGGVIVGDPLNCKAQVTPSQSIPEEIGYIKVNAFEGNYTDQNAIAYVKEMWSQIEQRDRPGLKGWIVDLRGNTGGNMWPMLAGIGPVLGDGIAGYFVDPEGNESSTWGIDKGFALIGKARLAHFGTSYTLITPNPKVAVLLDNAVVSSGEVLAITFIGRTNTKSFGESTCGMSTSNTGFVLSDNSTLFLTTHHLADRNKKIYGFPIEPDIVTNTTLKDAVEWLSN
jgi:hypothetical protein